MNEKSLRVLDYGKIIDRLADKCTSSLGRELVEALQPMTVFEDIMQCLKETSEAQGIIFQRGNIPLGGIHDIIHLVRRTEIGSYLDPGQLLHLKETLAVARKLKSFFKNDNIDRKFPIIEGLAEGLSTFRELEEKIDTCILSESELSDNASPELRNIRRQILSKNDAIRNKLNSIISSNANQKFLQDAIITMRQDRYVVPVKSEHRQSIPGLIHDQSSSGATLFIEPMVVVELNNQLKELRLKERVEIERILMEIAAMIAERAAEIKGNQGMLQQLDFLFAKGKLSNDMKAIEPVMNREGKVYIKNGRHPLLKQNEVVANTVWLGDEFHVLVITGPNTGGKTVTLKTVGLLCLMAQSGLHVPADYGTKMTVFDQVFADIGDEQSIEQSLSTFSSHMTNIVKILEDVTPNSLVLFDELGAGTDPTEGAALAMAILEHLRYLNTRVIATTHYSELKQYALVNKEIENASVEFDVETLRPTYKLLIGVPGKSNAFEISRKLGLRDELIYSAKEFISTENIHFEDLLQNIERNRSTTEKEMLEAKKARDEADRLLSEYYSKKQQVEEQRDKIIREAKKEAQKLLKEAKAEAEEIIINLREMKLELEEKEMNRRIEESKKKLSQRMVDLGDDLGEQLFTKVNRKPPKNLKAGEAVKILSLDQEGFVVSPEDSNGDVLIQVGIMKISMKVSNLERVKAKTEAKATGVGKILKSKTENLQRELDIRGYNLEEAMLAMDKFLDDCYIAGVTPVTIIHGIGTGVLSAGIKQLLKKHKHVKSYRPGQYGEGGAGVTIVEIK